MKFIVLCGLLAVALAASSRHQQQRDRQQQSQQWLRDAEPFRAGHEYTYQYKSQMASGIGSLDQHSTQLLTANAHIHFETERVAILRLRDVKVGVRNDQIAEPHRLQHTQSFEGKEIEGEILEKLQMACRFEYVDGLIDSISFNDKDHAWSKNIKRAVLNLLQLNMKRRFNNIQGVDFEQQKSQMEEDKSSITRMFTMPETTLEGYCQTTYTLDNKRQSDDSERDSTESFNVTKSIDFNQCKQLAFLRYGPRLEAPTYEAQQQKLEKIEIDRQQQLDRSTTFRYQLTGTQEKYGLARAEVVSQYVYKLMNAENQHPMQTIVVGELQLRSTEKKSRQEVTVSQKEETLQYSLEWDHQERRFYQYGDAEFTPKTGPFSHLHNKVGMIVRLIEQITKTSWNREHGISAQNTLKVQEAVYFVRMCSVPELEKVMDDIKKEEHGIFADILAIAGTRNTIHFIVEKTLKREFHVPKAVQALRQLHGLFAVSSNQVEDILKLCRSSIAKESSALRQSCMLSFGSMVNELCKESSLSMSKEAQEQCPRNIQEKYHNALMAEYKDAETTYEKILALKTIGNAGLHKSMAELEKIIVDKREHTVVRQQAIDSLRRFRTQMPVKVQRILLPIFTDVQERPEIRMTAFSIIMYTIPQKNILDQLTYTLFNERNQHVRSFVYTTLRAYSQSPIEAENELAKHLQSVLKMSNVNEDGLRMSRYYRIPIYSQEQREGFLVNLATGYSSSTYMPHHMSLTMDSLFNGLLEQKNWKIDLTQTNLEQLINKLWEQATNSRSVLRSQRRSSQEENGRDLMDDVFNTLKIQRGGNKNGFGMLSLRIRDVDFFVLPLSEESMPEMIKDFSLGQIVQSIREQREFKLNTIASLHERVMKIATSAGLPLRLSHVLPVIASVEGKFHVTHEDGQVKVNLDVKPKIGGVHNQKMELWTPFINTGVEVLHHVALNAPVKMTVTVSLNKDSEERVKIHYTVPEDKYRIVDFSSMPLTFTRDFNQKTELHGEPTIKTIHNQVMDSRYVEIEDKEEQRRSVSVNGFYHAPTTMTYQGIFSMLTVTENHMTVDFTPRDTTPKALELVIKGKLFEDGEKTSHRPEYKKFFESNTNSKKYNNDDEEDQEDMERMDQDFETESDDTRGSRFNKYISESYKANKVYNHHIRAIAKTIGGSQQHKTDVELKATCDSHMTFCKINTEVKVMPNEEREWKLKAKTQILAPEYVKNVEQLKDNMQNKLAVNVECEWGSDRKQRVNIKIEGERAVPQKWTEQRWQRVLATAFINKYTIVADYKIDRQQQQQWVNSAWNMVKTYLYWNKVNEKNIDGEKGEIKATIMIDPLTRRYVNMTVRTPREMVRFNNIVLPMTVKPFTLVRPQEKAFEIHSTSDLMNKWSDSQKRAECRVDGRKIKTFDSVVYKAPLGKCYSVIAKDCVDKTFAVLMKTLDKETMQKKIKIINNRDVITVEPRDENELRVTINGRRVSDTQELADNGVNYDDELVRVNLPQGVVVRFDGKQATVKLSQYYQNAQCGLCGQWNGDEEDEFRKSDDTETDDVKEFHKSFSGLKGGDDEECDESENKKMYNEDSLFGKQMSRSNMDDEDQDDFEDDEDVDTYKHFDRKSDRSSSRRQNNDRDSREDRDDQDDDNTETSRPVSRTHMKEHSHKLCFSKTPVKQCPRGSYAEETEEKKVQYACLERSSSQARRLLRKARTQDISSELEAFKMTLHDDVRVAVTCSA